MRRRCRNFLPRNRKSALNFGNSRDELRVEEKAEKRLKIFSAITCKAFWLNPMRSAQNNRFFE
jgi:hypothetical protein